MTIVVNTNLASLNAQRNLNGTQNALNTALERLSSGRRINSAADDAAGLAISTRFTAQIRGINQAVRNANDGISLAQTAEGALNESTNILQRMRELAVQAANDTNSAADRTSIQNEIDQLVAELDRIDSNTTFNGLALFDSAGAGFTLQVGPDDAQTIVISAISDVDAATLAVDALDVSDNTNAGAAITSIDAAIDTVNTERATLGAIENRLESTIANLQNVSENLSAARSRIEDADFAQETANLTRAQILQQSGLAVLSQANASPQVVLSLLQ